MVTDITEDIKNITLYIMDELNIDRMPTIEEIRNSNYRELERMIYSNGGMTLWAKKLNLPTKKKIYIDTSLTKEEEIIRGIKQVQEILKINCMPTYSQIRTTLENGCSITGLISKGNGYRYYANLLNLDLQTSETNFGIDYEFKTLDMLLNKGFEVEKMSVKHPYDLLVNKETKIDVKTSNLHNTKTGSFFKFNIWSKKHNCDYYIAHCVLDEEIFKTLIIPSKELRSYNFSVGMRSKYDVYKDKWDLIKQS
ncbi:MULTISPECIES: hypothetical protein [Lysinibacillus]|uniref:hypothetical protein n=1 Tax=Lysinibacillus TaxID=400634 RepID=UPI00214BA05F|nr:MULTISPECIES: hypothetical protein [Lysinibacillus]UUV25969.1 hypothetical protein NP781_04940 [Lysinibacillus sp. FN11]UYB48842.1 hypothetical protein OCI51_07730 [Lysinibacillus capsici]